MIKLTTEKVLSLQPIDIQEMGEEYVNHFFTLGYITSNEFDVLLDVFKDREIDIVEVYFGGRHNEAFRLQGCTEKEIVREHTTTRRSDTVKIEPVLNEVGVGKYFEYNRKPSPNNQLPAFDANYLTATICSHVGRGATRGFGGIVTPHSIPSFRALRVYIPQNRLSAE